MFTRPNWPACTASRSHNVAGSKRKMCPTWRMRFCLSALRELFCFVVGECDWFFHKHIPAGFEEFVAQQKMRLRGRHDDGAIHFAGKVLVICREARGGKVEFAGRLKLFLADFSHVKLDGHRIEVAQ